MGEAMMWLIVFFIVFAIASFLGIRAGKGVFRQAHA